MIPVRYVGGPLDRIAEVIAGVEPPVTLEFPVIQQSSPFEPNSPYVVADMVRYHRCEAWSDDGCRFYAVAGYTASLIGPEDVKAAVDWIADGPEGAFDVLAASSLAGYRKELRRSVDSELRRHLENGGNLTPDDSLGYMHAYPDGTRRTVSIRAGYVRGVEYRADGPTTAVVLRDRRNGGRG